MRSILEIVTFFTPIDQRSIVEEKEKAIADMIMLSLQNAWDTFEKNTNIDIQYSTTIYTLEGIKIEISIKNDSQMEDYYLPHLLLSIFVDEKHFIKENIESFLNTITRFFSWMYKEDYFVAYDTKFDLIEMNSGKKYSLDDIKNIDTDSITSKKNKNLLDSLLYLHYTLDERIQDISSLEQDAKQFQSSRWEFIGSLHITELRKDETKENLIQNRAILHTQIEILLQYFL